MDRGLQKKLDELRIDYERIIGHPFTHFFCPLLFTDEATTLCRAHIVNQAFENPDGHQRIWTVQRADLDNFYGAMFESRFVLSQYDTEEKFDALLNSKKHPKTITRRIYLNGQEVASFPSKGTAPEGFSLLQIEYEENRYREYVVKMPPSEILANAAGKWEEGEVVDLSVQGPVSLVKAAFLTLFELFGYQYALSTGGRLIGKERLGKFFQENRGKSPQEILKSAEPFFSDLTRLVQGVVGENLTGTINDGQYFQCRVPEEPVMGYIVLVKSAHRLDGVLLPRSAEKGGIESFNRFLKSDQPVLLETQLYVSNGQQGEAVGPVDHLLW